MSIALAVGCTAGAPAERGATAARETAGVLTQGQLPLRSLMQEYNTGLRDSTRQVITDSATLARTWDQAYARRGSPPPVPPIDFIRETVILASLGVRSSGGYTIRIDSAVVRGELLHVYVRKTSPGPTCGATAALTEPASMVAIPRTAARVVFHEISERSDCGD